MTSPAELLARGAHNIACFKRYRGVSTVVRRERTFSCHTLARGCFGGVNDRSFR